MNERKRFLQFKYIAKSIIYILFAVVVWKVSESFTTYRPVYLTLMVIIVIVSIFYDYLKYNIELIMGMVAEARDIDEIMHLINKVEKLDKINGVKNSLILPKTLLLLDANNAQEALEYVDDNENFMRSKLDYLLIYKYVYFKAKCMLENQEDAITAYHDLLKLKETNLKNKHMKLLFNWEQIEALYELQIKNYKRSKNLYSRCNTKRYNNREMIHYYHEQQCLALKTRDKTLYKTCHENISLINASSPLNLDWR